MSPPNCINDIEIQNIPHIDVMLADMDRKVMI